MAKTSTGSPHPPASGELTAAQTAGTIYPARSGCTKRCLSGQSTRSERTLSAKPGFLKITLNTDTPCRWDRPFAFGEQGGDWFRYTGKPERYLDDCRNWPTATDCAAKIRDTASNPRPQDRDPHFGSRN